MSDENRGTGIDDRFRTIEDLIVVIQTEIEPIKERLDALEE